MMQYILQNILICEYKERNSNRRIIDDDGEREHLYWLKPIYNPLSGGRCLCILRYNVQKWLVKAL